MGDGSNTLCCNPFASCFSPAVSKERATFFANIVQVLQEFIAVAFHLVCLSRLEATSDIKSNLVLFLTLVVFTGPYLNAWLVFAEYIIFKKWKGNMIWENILIGIGITAAHVVGSLLAWGCVLGMQPASVNTITWNKKNAITWNITDPTKQTEALNVSTNWHVHFFEEIFAVASLLIGFIYLIWLTKLRKAKSIHKYESIIKIDIKFYFQLTLLVAAVGQAFPSAMLSPHVLSYKLLMQTITIPEVFSRLGGGAIGLIIASLWCLFRVSYRKTIQIKLDDEHDHNVHVYEQVPTGEAMHTVSAVAGSSRQMPGIRLAMHGSSYF
jgi:hypothetical protein